MIQDKTILVKLSRHITKYKQSLYNLVGDATQIIQIPDIYNATDLIYNKQLLEFARMTLNEINEHNIIKSACDL